MKLKRVIHIIDSLRRGGAETLLVNYIHGLEEHQNIIVTLFDTNDFEEELPGVEYYPLGYRSPLSMPKTVLKLHKLIKKLQPNIIHSHLYWSTIVARLALPKEVKLITTYHSFLFEKKNQAEYGKKIHLLERLTYRQTYHSIYISEAIKKSVMNAIGKNNNHTVINNFVSDKFFQEPKTDFDHSHPINAVMVGSFKKEKNHRVAIEAIAKLAGKVNLDLFGDGAEKNNLIELSRHLKIENNINFCGVSNVLDQELAKYDVFIMPSLYEGFGIALIEAMSKGLPCIVSDIEVFRSIGKEACLYFNSSSAISLKEAILVFDGLTSIEKEKLAKAGIDIASQYNRDSYISNLSKLYQSVCAE